MLAPVVVSIVPGGLVDPYAFDLLGMPAREVEEGIDGWGVRETPLLVPGGRFA